MTGNKEFDEMAAEFEAAYPEEMAAARIWAKEYFDKIRSGEEKLDIRPLIFDEELGEEFQKVLEENYTNLLTTN